MLTLYPPVAIVAGSREWGFTKKGEVYLKKVKLREVAHARGGEKGDAVSVAVIAYREEDYPLLKAQVTAEIVGSAYDGVSQGDTRRYEIPSIGALNFVLEQALVGVAGHVPWSLTSPARPSPHASWK